MARDPTPTATAPAPTSSTSPTQSSLPSSAPLPTSQTANAPPTPASQKNGSVQVTTYIYHSDGSRTRLGGVNVHIQSVGYATTDRAYSCDNYNQTTDSSGAAASNGSYGQAHFNGCWTGSGGKKQYQLSYVQIPSSFSYRSLHITGPGGAAFASGGTSSVGDIAEQFDVLANQTTKLLIGSYGKKTNIRPPEDVDLLFKIPLEVFEQYQNYNGNGPAALLQRVRGVLGESYTTTDKISAWGKVVLVEFAGGKHNVELLPGYELDGVFMIPNTEDGGSWESFDARADLNLVADSHARTGGRTRKLVRMVKKWRKLHPGMTLKSHEIEQYCVEFLEQQQLDNTSWSRLVCDFFRWFATTSQQDISYIETARDRADKAREYELNDNPKEACNQWIKIFGKKTFPTYSTARDKIYKLNAQYPSDDEEYIEDLYPVRIDPAHTVSITATVSGKGFRDHSLGGFLAKFRAIPRRLSLSFEAISNVVGPTESLWKVRNFGEDAKFSLEGKGLRGEIRPPSRDGKKYETTLYKGTHYVECYIIQNGICVAKGLQFVPITNDETGATE